MNYYFFCCGLRMDKEEKNLKFKSEGDEIFKEENNFIKSRIPKSDRPSLNQFKILSKNHRKIKKISDFNKLDEKTMSDLKKKVKLSLQKEIMESEKISNLILTKKLNTKVKEINMIIFF